MAAEARIDRLAHMRADLDETIAHLEQQSDDGLSTTIRRLRLLRVEISTALDRLARRHGSLS